jgi:hypothetical protein
MNEPVFTGRQPDSGNPTVLDEMACGNVGYGDEVKETLKPGIRGDNKKTKAILAALSMVPSTSTVVTHGCAAVDHFIMAVRVATK